MFPTVYTGKLGNSFLPPQEGKRLRRFDKGVEQVHGGSAERRYFNEAFSFLQSDMSSSNKTTVGESGAYAGKRGYNVALPVFDHARSVHRNS